MYFRLAKLFLAISFLSVMALAEAVIGQVAELPIKREWGIEMAEPVRTIKMADIDGDGIDEILVGTGRDSGYVYVLNGITHETEWKSPGLIGRALSIGVGDSNGDSTKEIVVGTGEGISDSGNVYIFEGMSHSLEWHKGGLDERVYSLAIGDYDMDGSTEILVGTYYDWMEDTTYGYWSGKQGHLYVFDGYTHRQELGLSTSVVNKVKVLDVDQDGVNEAYTGESYDSFWDSHLPPHMDGAESQLRLLVRRDSTVLDARNLFYYRDRWIESPLPYFLDMAIANCDSDSTREIICSYFIDNWPSSNKVFAGLEILDGISLSVKWSREDTSPYYRPNLINGLAVADLNKDGTDDIVAAYSGGYIKVIDGVTSADSAVSPQTIPISHFAFGNVDEDEESEACISDGDSLILLEVHPFTAVKDRHQGHSSIPLYWGLSQNYPNPFNASTLIRYTVPQVAGGRFRMRGGPNSSHLTPITLKIYNILGQKVRTLVEGERVPGDYSVVWDGRDSRGNPVVSGIYFCRLEGLGEGLKVTKTRKMVLIR